MFVYNIIYSTDPNFKFEDETPEAITLLPEKQKLIVMIDNKKRAGKTVTLVKGFVGNNKDLEDLSKKIKNFCGTGGSVKEGEIIIQGSFKDKIAGYLTGLKYNVKIK